MEKILKLYTYVDGVNDTPFPSKDEQAVLSSFTYSAKRMGDAPSIVATLMHGRCLDDVFSSSVYVKLNEERYYLIKAPSSSKSNDDARYAHELEFKSEREVLNNIYFFDVVSDEGDDKYRSGDSNVVFSGDVREFASRINASLSHSKVDYTVIVDNSVDSTEIKLVSLQDKYISDALKEITDLYGLQYYFNGKTIHIGSESEVINEVFEYGSENALLSISKNNSNHKIVNRCSGRGSAENLPYYYPNVSPEGDIACYLNGVESKEITIVDFKKFSRCGVAGKLIYLEGAFGGEVIERWDENDLEEYGLESRGYWFNVPQYGMYIKFDIYVTIDEALLTVSCGKKVEDPMNPDVGTPWFEEASLYDSDENILWGKGKYDIYNNLRDFKVGKGKYTYVARFTLGQRNDIENIILNEIDFDATVTRTYYTEFDWYLNGSDFVKLSSIGLNYTGTPKDKDTITFGLKSERMPIVQNLMPSIFRETNGTNRFYNAKNGEYLLPQSIDEYYTFENEYSDVSPSEYIADFSDIKPSIKGATNSEGFEIGEFIEFDYDDDDNDEKDENGGFKHPYFYAKLRKFNGEFGFNLFGSALEGSSMTLSVESGSCIGCKWAIGVDDELKNPIQVYEYDTTVDGIIHRKGSLVKNEFGDVVRSGVPQDVQNDTVNNEVWIALKKDDQTYGVLMPNSTNKYRPAPGDKFVILNISLPMSYILLAEKKLEDEVIKYMSENNYDKFNFSIKFSKVYLANNPAIVSQLDENCSVKIRYNGLTQKLQVSSYTYKVSEDSPLPEITVTLEENVSIPKNAIEVIAQRVVVSNQNEIEALEQKVYSVMPTYANTKTPTKFDENAYMNKDLTIGRNLKSSDYDAGNKGGVGWSIYRLDGDSILEIDKIFARKSITLNELIINQIKTQKGAHVFSMAACNIVQIEDRETCYRCYYEIDGGTQSSGFIAGDQALCQIFDSSYKDVVRYYWRLVVGVGIDYVDLSKTDFDGDAVPSIGDTIVQLGNRNDSDRQNAIVISSTPKPSIIQYANINSYSLTDDKIVTKITPDGNKFTGRLDIKPGSVGATNFSDLPEVVEESVYNTFDATEFGSQNILVNSGFAGDYLTHKLNNTTNLNGEDNMFSNNLAHWSHENASVQSSQNSASGFEVVLTDGSISQSLYTNLIAGESYVASFKASGDVLTLSIGGIEKTIELTDSYERYVEKFVATSNTEFVIKDASCAICDIQLERGTVASAWGYSPLDNSSQLAYYQSLKYLSNAIQDGGTSILGGLILSNMMMLGNTSNGYISEITSGVSGVSNSDEDVAFWGGGTYEQAVATAYKYATDMSYTPSDEELENMAKYVVTHGGRSILNDVILHGYVYAKGGKFGNLEVGVDAYGEPDIIASHKDEAGYNYKLNLNPARLIMTGNDDSHLEYESVTIAPVRDTDRIGSGGLMNLTARRGYKALVIEEGSIDGLRPTSTVTSSQLVDIISHTTIVNGTSDQTLVLPHALYEGDGKVYHIINAKKGGYLKIMSYNSAINNCIGYEVSTVNTGQVLTLTANERSLWAICVDGEWFLHK